MQIKFVTLLIVTVSMAALALAAESSSSGGHPATESLTILGASYSYGGQHADVTERVKELLRENKTFAANPQWLQVDPHPGMNKALFIYGEVGGQPKMLSVGEGENVSCAILFEKAWAVSTRTDAKIDLQVTFTGGDDDGVNVFGHR